MTEDRTGRELEPRSEDRAIAPVLERPASVDRFDAGERAHTVGLTEERSAQIVRQSGNARTVGLLATLIVALFIPIYWFYDIGIPALGASGRLEAEADVQYVTDVSRGYALYLANCARCHGEDGEGGIGPPLNDQNKLYNALTAERLPGTGHLNPNYLDRVMEVGGRYVCGDANSVMPAWKQPAGPLNYREVEEIIAFITASSEIEFTYDPAAHGEAAAESPEPARQVTGWRDPAYQPPPGRPTPPACWRNPSGTIGGGAPGSSIAPVESPGTADSPRVIPVEETAALTIVDAEGALVSAIGVVPGEVIRFEVENSANFGHNFFIGPMADLEANVTGELTGVPEFTTGVEAFDWTVPEELAEGLEFACTIPGHYATMHGSFVSTEGGGGPTPSGSAEPAPSGSAEPAPSGSAEPSPSGSPQPSVVGSPEPAPSGSAEPAPSGSAAP